MSTLQRIGAGFGLLCGIIIAAIGMDLAWDTIASGELVGAFIVLAFVALPGMGTVAGLTVAMYREDRDRPRPGTYSGPCADDWSCWCRSCTEHKTGILPD